MVDQENIIPTQKKDIIGKKDEDSAKEFWDRTRNKKGPDFEEGLRIQLQEAVDAWADSIQDEKSFKRKNLNGDYSFFTGPDGPTEEEILKMSALREIAKEKGYWMGRFKFDKQAYNVSAPFVNLKMIRDIHSRCTRENPSAPSQEPIFGQEAVINEAELAELKILVNYAQIALDDLLARAPDYPEKVSWREFINKTLRTLEAYENNQLTGKPSKKFGEILPILFRFLKDTDKYLRQ